MTDIIIPIYNAFDDLKSCLESVYRHTNLEQNRLILINDNSSDLRINDYLKIQSNRNNVIIITNSINKGFSANINIGFKQSNNNDVILLNSDTIVTKDWVEKIERCAYSNDWIGTVTPLSNNATLCSVPILFEENELPANISVDEAADIVERVSFHEYPRITVANGFCMFIKRKVIDLIGNFDEVTFQRGYGEENDFCNRAEQAGFIHVMCDDTYIFHSGSKSFLSSEKAAYIAKHEKILRDRYPYQMRNNDIFCRDNPLKYIGDNINLYFELHNQKSNILFVLQSGFMPGNENSIGGTQLHVKDLTYGLKADYNIFVVARDKNDLILYVFIDEKIKRYKFNIGEIEYFPMMGNREIELILEDILSGFNIDLVHVHHTYGIGQDIFMKAKELSVPIVFTAHDFYYICPNIKLRKTDKSSWCDSIKDDECDECLNTSLGISRSFGFSRNWREKNKKILELCDKIVVPSRSSKKIFLSNDMCSNEKITVIEHGSNKYDLEMKNKPCVTSNDFICHIDRITYKDLLPCISGWAYLKNENCENDRIYLQIESKCEKHYIPASQYFHKDILKESTRNKIIFKVFIPSKYVDDSTAHFTIIIEHDSRFYTSSYGEIRKKVKATNKSNFNVAFIGGINKEKGSLEITNIIKHGSKEINWFIFGGIGDRYLYRLHKKNLVKTGVYNPDQLSMLLKEHQIDLVCILSNLPETFSYTLSEAKDNRIPVIATDIGALGERIRNDKFGWLVSPSNVEQEVLSLIDRIKEKGKEYYEIYDNLSDIKGKSIEEMCAEYSNLYEALMEQKKREYSNRFSARKLFLAFRRGTYKIKVGQFIIDDNLSVNGITESEITKSIEFRIGWVICHPRKFIRYRASKILKRQGRS